MLEVKTFFPTLKMKKDTLEENLKIKIYMYLQDRMSTQNVATLYKISEIFGLSHLKKLTVSFIQRHFKTVTGLQSFLEVDFDFLKKLLSDSELETSSEVEVFNAAYAWISHNIKERSKHTRDILSTVRFPLMSDHALKHVTDKISSFRGVDDCFVEDILKRKNGYLNNKHFTHRYCKQNKFNVLIGGGMKAVNIVENFMSLNGEDLKSLTSFDPLKVKRRGCKMAYLKGDVYFFGGFIGNNRWCWQIAKYSVATKTFTEKAAKMRDRRYNFCVCAFMDNFYIIEGSNQQGRVIKSCLRFDPTSRQWKQISGMNISRESAACAVFQGEIVVTGGWNCGRLKTVEAYDHVGDVWRVMPEMIEARGVHGAVAMGNKLFVIGGGSQVFMFIFRKS